MLDVIVGLATLSACYVFTRTVYLAMKDTQHDQMQMHRVECVYTPRVDTAQYGHVYIREHITLLTEVRVN